MIKQNKLIIFDMDNTLIHSHLDFALMKAETLRLLKEGGYKPDETLPLTQIMELYSQSGQLTPGLAERIWRRLDEIEHDGLENAGIEPGIEKALEFLSKHAHLTALTNTVEKAARAVLLNLGLARWLDHIMGRGGAPQLKPACGGMLALLAQYPHLTAADTLAVGDAIIDIRAAREAGLRFCAYNRSRAEQWPNGELKPDLQLYHWDESAARQLLALLDNEVVAYG